MAQGLYPHNIISTDINVAIDDSTDQMHGFDNDVNNWGINSLVFQYPRDVAVSIQQIHYSLAELDGNGANQAFGKPTRKLFSKLWIVQGYNAELRDILIDPFYNPRNLAATPLLNNGWQPLDYFGPIADIQKNSRRILFERIIEDSGSGEINFRPPVEPGAQSNDNIVVVLTPTYSLNGTFYGTTGAGLPTYVPNFGDYIGHQGGGFDQKQFSMFRTLSVRGCIK